MSYDAPFAGLKVIDLSQGIAGPYCAMLLAQHGAQVIKVESIGEGDWARTLGARYGSHSAFSIIGNLGKRSIAVDLKTEAGKQVRVAPAARAPTSSSKASGRASSGGWASTTRPSSAREPRLLYLSISGFGQTGPLAERPAMDPVLQAYTGLMAENRGEDGIPHRVPVIVVDMSTALYAFQALSAALYARRDETRGRYIDVSLMQAATALQSIRLMACHLEGGTMKPGGAPGGVFQTADGWMSILAINDRDWQEPLRGDGHAGAGRRSALRRSGVAARQRRRALCHRAAGDRGAALRRLDPAPHRRPHHARAAEQLRRVPRPAARARNRPDPVAGPGRRRPRRCRCPLCPARCRTPTARRAPTAPVTGPAHARRSWPSTATAPREIDALLAEGTVAAAGMTSPCSIPRSTRRTPWKNGGGVTVDIAGAGRDLALRPHADRGARALLRLCAASTACRSWSPAAAWCCRRPTARSTCARRSSRCASPARRRSSAGSKRGRSRSST